jgi:hypothetical protein
VCSTGVAGRAFGLLAFGVELRDGCLNLVKGEVAEFPRPDAETFSERRPVPV